MIRSSRAAYAKFNKRFKADGAIGGLVKSPRQIKSSSVTNFAAPKPVELSEP